VSQNTLGLLYRITRGWPGDRLFVEIFHRRVRAFRTSRRILGNASRRLRPYLSRRQIDAIREQTAQLDFACNGKLARLVKENVSQDDPVSYKLDAR
jgi:hypothetical protein